MEAMMLLSLETLSKRVEEKWGVKGSVAVAVNRDGSVDGELRLTHLGDKDGRRAYAIMFGIDVGSMSEGPEALPVEKRMFVPPPDNWVSIGVALSHWDSRTFEVEERDLQADFDLTPEEAIDEIRSRYARFQGLDFVANYPQMVERLADTQVTAREILQRAITIRGGYVHQIVYRLAWSEEGSRPEHLRTKQKVVIE